MTPTNLGKGNFLRRSREGGVEDLHAEIDLPAVFGVRWVQDLIST
jgi:hypothetical protein